MSRKVALVGVNDGMVARGKITPQYFLPPFEQRLGSLGIEVQHYAYQEFVRAIDHRHDAAIFVYSEVPARRSPQFWHQLEQAERAAQKRQTRVIHGPSIGRIVADKSLTHAALSRSGIEMPRLASDAVAPYPVFSNHKMSSHAPVFVVEPGHALDQSRYNTQLIDTRCECNGKSYHVGLRAMAVGRRCVSILLRLRPAGGDPSVHTSDTPVDAGLWNDTYRRHVAPQTEAIRSLCERIGTVLGLGFYAHDILVESSTQRLLLCETGFKFDDADYRERLMPLTGQLCVDDFLVASFPEKAADYFGEELAQTSGKVLSVLET